MSILDKLAQRWVAIGENCQGRLRGRILIFLGMVARGSISAADINVSCAEAAPAPAPAEAAPCSTGTTDDLGQTRAAMGGHCGRAGGAGRPRVKKCVSFHSRNKRFKRCQDALLLALQVGRGATGGGTHRCGRTSSRPGRSSCVRRRRCSSWKEGERVVAGVFCELEG